MKSNRPSEIFSVISDLIKLKLSLAVVLSSVTGYYLYRNNPDMNLLFLALGIFFLASGSAVLNQYTERETDLLMERTKNRPIPSKKISENSAIIIFSILLLSGCIFLLINGIKAMTLGIITVVFYNFIYTRLKRSTIFSIIPGALVGAIPPVIGFVSAGSHTLNSTIFCFSAFIFLWQLPHFWLIVIKYGKEYRSAGFATITKYLNELQIRYLVFFWVLFSTLFLFFFFSLTEAVNKNLFILLSVMNFIFIIMFYRLLFRKNVSTEIRNAFIMINTFSFLIMILLIALSILKGI